MLEALACGTPVLAFDEGAAGEVVQDGRTGFLCTDEGHMAEVIGRVDGCWTGRPAGPRWKATSRPSGWSANTSSCSPS